MPVWGYQFTGRFLEFCLPTLLAPNNIPAIAQALPCRFILLSTEVDKPVIRSHPAWQRLEEVCAAEIQLIDDLITSANHTATITLAFERALRQAGDAMLQTCFIFLMSDYLVADGSLKTVLATIQKGASCVLAGNFQITVEDAAPLLRAGSDPASLEIVLPPRDLVRWSLAHLHPATVANIVNFGLTHNAHTNRLFWRVDENSLIGRFYLLHPIAIHPEVADFVVAASWDYSFVPELCPSNNTVTLTDSDEYLVIELQQRKYESDNLRPGRLDPREFAFGISQWTTANHRRNVEQTLLFHAADRPPDLAQFVAQADFFVDRVRELISTAPAAHQQHPYWVGSIAMSKWRTNRPLNKNDWAFLLSDRPQPSRLRAALERVRAKLFGYPPDVTRLHPFWPDFELPVKALDAVLSSKGRVLLLANVSEAYAQWTTRVAGDVVTIDPGQLLKLASAGYAPLVNTFDACLLTVRESEIDSCDKLLDRLRPLLKANGKLYIVIFNDRPSENAAEFGQFFTLRAARFLNPSAWIGDVQYVAGSPLRWSIRAVANRFLVKASRSQLAALPYVALTAGPVLLATYFANLAAKRSRIPPAGIWSSVFITLEASGEPVQDPARFMGATAFNHRGLPSQVKPRQQAAPAQEQLGVEGLDLMASQLWQHDPAQFSATLASYQFVAKLMGNRLDVAEFGCASAFGTRLVLQQVKKITLFDPRQVVVGDLQRRFGEDWAFEAYVHDILARPLPRQVDSIYSIDFIQYLSRDEERTFLRNLRDSLSPDFDFVLIGGSSYQRHDGRAENARIYRRTAEELKALVAHYFHSVFMFSMVDDIVQPGMHPNAQHVFALGCGAQSSPKTQRPVLG